MLYSSLKKALVPVLLVLAQNTLAQGTCAKKDGVTLTFFGLGSAGVYTKFKCSGTSVNQNSLTASTGADAPRVKSGVGSYEDPALFATAASNTAFSRCEIIYIPYFKKYYQYGDICAQCESDFQANGLTKVDLWIGPNPTDTDTDATVGGDASCQIAGGILPDSSIIHDPPKDLEVQSKALQGGSGDCWKSDSSRSFPSNEVSCSGGGGGGNTDTTPDETLEDSPVVENLQQAQVETPKEDEEAPAPSPTPTSTPAPAPTDPPIVQNKAAVVQDDKPTTLTTTVTSMPPPFTTTVTIPASPTTSSTSKSTFSSADATPTGSSSSSSSSSAPTPPTQPVKAVTEPEKDTPEPKKDNPETTQPQDSTQQNQTQTTTGKAGDLCPVNGWFPGCVWGSGKGQIGETCKAKTDCWGEGICVSGKCEDHLKGKRGLHRRHARRAVHIHGLSH